MSAFRKSQWAPCRVAEPLAPGSSSGAPNGLPSASQVASAFAIVDAYGQIRILLEQAKNEESGGVDFRTKLTELEQRVNGLPRPAE